MSVDSDEMEMSFAHRGARALRSPRIERFPKREAPDVLGRERRDCGTGSEWAEDSDSSSMIEAESCPDSSEDVGVVVLESGSSTSRPLSGSMRVNFGREGSIGGSVGVHAEYNPEKASVTDRKGRHSTM
jgi:hypothetical protein